MLTSCYHAAFGLTGGTSSEDELILLTAPLSATNEVETLYTAGLIDYESAIPCALHSLGASASEITEALRRRRKQEKDKGGIDAQGVMADMELRRAQALKTSADATKVPFDIEKTKADTEAVRTGMKKTMADTKKAEHDAKAPFPSRAPAGGAS